MRQLFINVIVLPLLSDYPLKPGNPVVLSSYEGFVWDFSNQSANPAKPASGVSGSQTTRNRWVQRLETRLDGRPSWF
jgi:hypothetical protein